LHVGVSNSSSTSTVRTAPLVRPALGLATTLPLRIWAREVGKRGCEGRLRASMCSKLRSNGRGTRRLYLCFVADGRRESYQASRRCSQRQPVHAFEPGKLDGTRIVTTKILQFDFGVIGKNTTK
jgi:hypothetical protein